MAMVGGREGGDGGGGGWSGQRIWKRAGWDGGRWDLCGVWRWGRGASRWQTCLPAEGSTTCTESKVMDKTGEWLARKTEAKLAQLASYNGGIKTGDCSL